MRIGVVFPQIEFPPDPAAIHDYAQAIEGMGYTHILAYDHVLGANPDRPGGWQGPYTYEHTFYSPFLLFSFMTPITSTLEFTTGIIILPQRPTALVAKQAATLDVLSGGRLRLGVGIGWNSVEYTALNQNFNDRGRRSEEQVALMKKLWAEPLITYEGQWHTIPDAGIAPLPVKRTIPVWFGGYHANTVRRVAALGDGWMPNYRGPDDEQLQENLELLDAELEKAGRTRDEIGYEARVVYTADHDALGKSIESWRAFGATHLSINTMYLDFDTPEKHLNALRAAAESLDLA